MNIEKDIENLRKEYNGGSFSLLAERCETSNDAPYRIKKADKIKRDDVVVLCLAGTGGNKINLRGYNSMLKKVDNFVKKECGDEVRVVVACSEFGEFHDHKLARKAMHWLVSWPNHYEELKRSVNKKHYEETFNPKYIRDIYNEIFEPRLADDKGNRFKLDEVLRNIRRVNIVSHCHGGYVAMSLEGLMDKRMTELGYNKEEQNKIKEQVLSVMYNPDCPYVVSKMKSVGIVSSQDNHNTYNNYMKEWLLMEPHYFGVCYMPKKWGRTLMCDMVNKKSNELIEIGEDFDLFNKNNRGLSEHEFLGFEYDKCLSKGGETMQKMGGNILANGVINSLRQKKKFVSIPRIENLVARTFDDKVEFAKACIIGWKLEQKLYKVDRKEIDNYANWRRSLPVVTLD